MSVAELEPTIATSGLPLSNLSAAEFAAKFNAKPFIINHSLQNHPLFQLPRLVELSKALPTDRVEYNSGVLPVTQDPTSTPSNGLSIEETIRRIEECNSWMVLKNVENDPEYRALLDDCLDQIEEITREIAPGMKRREGFIFISSAGSVTPFHVDPENNFLLQIRGHKQVQLFDVEDRFVISEEQLEKFFTGAHRNIPYKPEFEDRGPWFDLNPGDGLHFPVAAPHWVKNGTEVSVSFSITFQTDCSERRQSLHRLNNQLRKIGIVPQPVGASSIRDDAKFALVRSGRFVKQLFGRG